MNKRQFQRYLDRDQYCQHCGLDDETLVPNHRASRGAGGSKSLDRPSNVVVLCSLFNGLIESDSRAAELARRYGWKLERWERPEEQPIFDVMQQKWFILDNEYNRGERLERE